MDLPGVGAEVEVPCARLDFVAQGVDLAVVVGIECREGCCMRSLEGGLELGEHIGHRQRGIRRCPAGI